jgi:oligopeptide transport system substrate-binding protein
MAWDPRGWLRLRNLTVLGACAVLLAGSACGNPGAGSGAAAGGPAAGTRVLRLTLSGDPPTLNPVLAVSSLSFDVLNQTMEGLTRLAPDGSVQPGIAQSWQEADGGRTWTFHLRRAQWSNGDPLRASDFVYAWRLALDPRTGSHYNYQLQYLEGAQALIDFPPPPDPQKDPAGYRDYVQTRGPEIDRLLQALGVSAPDDRTLVVHLARPVPYWLGLTAFPTYFPADAKQVQAWGTSRYGTDAQYTLSDGPFMVTDWTHNGHLDLARNPRYWDAAHVPLDGVRFTIVPDANTVSNLYDTGQLDAILPTIPAALLDRYRGQPGFQTAPQAAVSGLMFQVRDPALREVHLRRALSESLPRQELVAAILRGGGQPATSFTPPLLHYAPAKVFGDLVRPVLAATADPAAARADLATALAALGLAAPPQLTLLVTNSTGPQALAAALQGYWKQNLGLTVRIQAVDPRTLEADLEQGRFQIAFLGFGADYDDPESFLDLFTTGNAQNFGRWSDPSFDAAIRAAQSDQDPARRGHDLVAAEQELLDQLPFAPLWWPTRSWIVRPGVRGLAILPTGPDYALKGVEVPPAVHA